MKKLHLLFAGAFAALAIVACSDDELETETKTETETETDEGNTGDENTGDENTGEEEEAPEAYITLGEESLKFGKAAGEATVTVDANYDWNAEYESDWFTVVADTNAGTITVSCDANGTGEVREGTVTVTAGDGKENVAEATLTITQSIYEADALVLEYTITSDNTTIRLPLGKKAYNDDNEYSVDCTVDWGDGSEVETVTGSFPSHTYSEVGIYTVIINGTVELLCSRDLDNWKNIDGKNCLTAVKQWGDLGLKSMDYAFYNCTNLTSLPDGPGPFSNVTSFFAAFYGCINLIFIPEDIFSDCTSATNFYAAFYYCESLTTVPEDMFSNCTAAEDFAWVFADCHNLISAPSFKGLSNATDFSYAFYYCEPLTTVPEDMFSGCTAAENFEYVFEFCYNLTSAPSFKGLSNVTSFYAAFWRCYPIATLPEDMFSGCTAAENCGAIFGYTSLTAVPEKLFADCPSVKSFEEVFCGCESLETVPVGIFDNNTLVTDFRWAFDGCSNLNGESPYTEIDVDGTPVKVHLYERENYSDHFTAPTTYSDCFTDCTGLDDYSSIPSGWGGGASPSSVTPQSLNATDREEHSPSHLSPHRDAATPQGSVARPLPTRK